MSILTKAWRVMKADGLGPALRKVRRRMEIHREAKAYQEWIRKYDTLSDEDRRYAGEIVEKLTRKPLISVLMPVYDVDEVWLRKAIDSVRVQLYSNWELCIADDNSTRPHVKTVLEEYAAKDESIKVVFRKTNGHISAASNSALDLVTGEFIALLDHDDELAEHALYLVAEAIDANPKAEIIYSDEDQIDTRGRRYDPKFKPDWSPEMFRSVNYTNHLTVYRTSLIRSVGGWRIGFEGSQDYDLMLRAIEKTAPENIRHIPHVLYHWRAVPGSVALASGEKSYAHERARTALNEHFERTGIAAKSIKGTLDLHRTVYSPDKAATVIIAGRDTGQTIRSILSNTDYPSFEVVVAGDEGRINDPRVKSIAAAGASRYQILNEAAKAAAGSVLCFIEGSTLIERPDWLRELAGHAMQSSIGAVGAKVLFEDRTIKHAGLILGIGTGVGRPHYRFAASHFGKNMRLSVAQNFSAVAADCLAVKKEVFERAGGFDADTFPDGYADVDFCLRLFGMGYRNVWTPWAEVIQRNAPVESDMAELQKLKEKWPGPFERDPYFNPNYSDESGDFSLASPPRIGKFEL